MNRDWFEGRLGYMQSNVQNRQLIDANSQEVLDASGNPNRDFSDKVKQRFTAHRPMSITTIWSCVANTSISTANRPMKPISRKCWRSAIASANCCRW